MTYNVFGWTLIYPLILGSWVLHKHVYPKRCLILFSACSYVQRWCWCGLTGTCCRQSWAVHSVVVAVVSMVEGPAVSLGPVYTRVPRRPRRCITPTALPESMLVTLLSLRYKQVSNFLLLTAGLLISGIKKIIDNSSLSACKRKLDYRLCYN